MKLRKLIRRLIWIGGAFVVLAGFGIFGFGIYKLKSTRSGAYCLDHTIAASIVESHPDAAQADTILYTSLRPSSWDIFLFNDLQSEPIQLTDHPSLDYNASLSPDGRWVIFTSERNGNADLFALNLEENGRPVPLTQDPAMDDSAAISPDGRKIAFVSTRGGDPDIYVMEFEPGNLDMEKAAINLTNNRYGDFNPDWSPDGRRIAFASNRSVFDRWNPTRIVDYGGFRTCVYLIGVDGSELSRLDGSFTKARGDPAWSGDGLEIIYGEADTRLNSRIGSVSLSGSKPRFLTPPHQRAIMACPGPEGGMLFVAIDGAGGMARFWATTSLRWVSADGNDMGAIGGDERSLFAPDYSVATGKLVCHGEGTTQIPMMSDDRAFTWPSKERMIQVGDRTVRLKAVRGYFPSMAETNQRILSIPWLHEADGDPSGPAPILSAQFDGREFSTIVSPLDDGFMWTPVITRNGEWIFYSKGPRMAGPSVDVDIWKVKKDGTGSTNLTPDSDANDAFCDLSADGNTIVFRSGRFGNHDIFLMDKDGNNVRRLSFSEGSDTMPCISPDGKSVVYVTTRTGRGGKLWIQSLDDSNSEGRLLEPRRAEITGMDMHPRFSPDGKWVVFTSDRGGMNDQWFGCGFFPQPYGDLYAMSVEGEPEAIRLTNDKWEDGLAFWGRGQL